MPNAADVQEFFVLLYPFFWSVTHIVSTADEPSDFSTLSKSDAMRRGTFVSCEFQNSRRDITIVV
jgi:hypothetical protein